MYKFALESFEDCFAELLPLFKLHYQEISANLDIPLLVDVERYQRMQQAGILKMFIARDEETHEIIGYAVYFVATNPHYMGSLQATQDVLFIHPDRRGFGKGFIARCDEELSNLGVQIVYQHVKVAHDWSKLLVGLGYKHVEHIFSKRLDDKES